MPRPQIKLQPTSPDRILEWTGRVLLTGMWALASYAYLTLPDTIATHFDASGRANGSGSKATLWILPIIATIIYVGITWLSSYPRIFNYPVQITEQNAARQYGLAVRMLRWLKLAIVVVFTLILLFACRASGLKVARLPAWLLPLMIVLMLLPTIIIVSQMLRQRDKSAAE